MEQIKEYEYVDLGLPSGLKWAKCNVGATSETDYGDYFMWGSTEPNTADECNWTTYKHCNGSESKLTKYNNLTSFGTVDNITTLESVDDAATQIMGSDWRMPTKDEIQELIDNTDSEWIEDFNGTGVNGRKFTSKADTSKYIFIPAAGVREDSSSFMQGFNGNVWSSSLFTSRPKNAWYLNFFSDDFYVDYADRNYGLMVRGVL